jgi:hypothetical protein
MTAAAAVAGLTTPLQPAPSVPVATLSPDAQRLTQENAALQRDLATLKKGFRLLYDRKDGLEKALQAALAAHQEAQRTVGYLRYCLEQKDLEAATLGLSLGGGGGGGSGGRNGGRDGIA